MGVLRKKPSTQGFQQDEKNDSAPILPVILGDAFGNAYL
jgi:hypothetical protein